ncbi:DUF3126 family protein [Hyphomonas sp.]|jgi:hypothetical protein|uniref:DUF3126 family protein n=1 Tax=Hyphomonas sp. TaxID=87 RepID=UPI000A887091|nr:DUF3126 family protein [Hyphomonas sp.]
MINKEETLRLEAYLKEKLNPGLRLLSRDKLNDSLEVYLGAEFLAVVYKDEEEGETSYQFMMTVLKEDIMGG